jgi:hypothetical protein
MAGDRGWRRGGLWIFVSFALMNRLLEFGSRNLKRLLSWIRSPSGGQAVFLVFAVVILFLLVGAVNRWRHGDGEGSVAVDIIWRVVWITYTICQVWLIFVVVTLLYRWRQRAKG